ncbi:hypothetical protein [Paenibacillus gansuensis]|uniref:Uncharacterized protein n=1 Tax=Paenibacillus gansuensis TaxID=306542 RepID=A0ABW5PE40_9BACL
MDKNGSLWMWGNNTFGQLGNSNAKTKAISPIKLFR